jgi:hypothetical protein
MLRPLEMNRTVWKVGLASSLAIALAAPRVRAEGTQVVDFVASEPGCPEPGFINERFWRLVGEGARSPGRAIVTFTKTESDRYEFSIRIDHHGGEAGSAGFPRRAADWVRRPLR